MPLELRWLWLDKKDQKQFMLDNNIAQFWEKKNIEAVIKMYGSGFNDIEEIFQDLLENRWIDKAVGKQLDGLGTIVVQDRVVQQAVPISFFGFSHQVGMKGFGQARFIKWYEDWRTSTTLLDEEYRKLIKAKIYKNNASWTIEDVIQMLSSVFETDIVVLQELGNAKFSVSIGRTLTEAEIAFSDSVKLFDKAGGVGVFRKAYFDKKFFGFAHQKYAVGFGQAPFATIF